MKQMSTGFGLAVLGACVLGAAFIASPRFGQQAFAQSTGDRRIVNVGVYQDTKRDAGMAYRVWSDGVIETRCVGYSWNREDGLGLNYWGDDYNPSSWKVVDNGQTLSFQAVDVNASGTVDSGDISNVLLDFGAEQVVNPAPSIECSINQIR
jgi:hypothetical protein